MNKIFFLVLLTLALTSAAFSQYDALIGSAGVSLGKGWGIDGSWGMGTFSENGFEHGWELLVSFGSPDFSSGNPAGEGGLFPGSSRLIKRKNFTEFREDGGISIRISEPGCFLTI